MNIVERLKDSLEYEYNLSFSERKQLLEEIDRLNNIINELEKYLYERFNGCRKCQIVSFKEHNNYSAYNGELLAYKLMLDKLKELKKE